VIQISADEGATILKADGSVETIGQEDAGPLLIPSGLTNVVQISAGYEYSLALKNNGTIVLCPTAYYSSSYASVPIELTNIVQVAAGSWYQNVALKSDGTVVVWGGSYGESNVPVGLTNVVQVAAGGRQIIALKGDGTVVTWGDQNNAYSSTVTNMPAGLTNIVQVAAGSGFSIALKNDGSVVTWGTYFGVTTLPVTPPSVTNVIAISANYSTAMALRADGSVVVWGNNTSGETNVPPSVTNTVQIAAGYNMPMAIVSPRQPQSISSFATVTNQPAYSLGQTLTVTPPTASSGLPVTISVYSGPATISGNTLTLTGPGTVVMVANQPGNAIYAPANPVSTSFIVGAQSIAPFQSIPLQVYSPRQTLTVTPPTASSDLPVTLSVLSGPATITGNTVTLRLVLER
jgi:hypothetical protein